jgi:hypothetical protein
LLVFITFAVLINQNHFIMKKSTLFTNALVAVFFASFVACSSPATEEAPAEEAAVEEVAEEMEEVVEEAVEAVDSLATEAGEAVEEVAEEAAAE